MRESKTQIRRKILCYQDALRSLRRIEVRGRKFDKKSVEFFEKKIEKLEEKLKKRGMK